MTRQSVTSQQNNVREQYQRTDADTEMLAVGRWKPECRDRVVPENDEKDDGHIKKIAMQILQNERKAGFAAITVRMRLAHGASRRIEKESSIVSLAIIITSSAKSERRPENQNCGRQGPPSRFD